MNNVFFHTALSVLNGKLKNKHITTMFSEFSGKGGFQTSNKECTATIKDIVFWKEAGVIVALVDCKLAEERFKFFSNLGYKYEYSYNPHITLEYSNKDNSSKYKELIGQQFKVGNEYFKPIYK